MNLKPCPCGKVPVKLRIVSDQNTPKYAHVTGDCCDMWETEYRADYINTDSPEGYALAVEAWNNAPRAAHLLEDGE